MTIYLYIHKEKIQNDVKSMRLNESANNHTCNGCKLVLKNHVEMVQEVSWNALNTHSEEERIDHDHDSKDLYTSWRRVCPSVQSSHFFFQFVDSGWARSSGKSTGTVFIKKISEKVLFLVCETVQKSEQVCLVTENNLSGKDSSSGSFSDNQRCSIIKSLQFIQG